MTKRIIMAALLALVAALSHAVNVGNPVTIYPSGTPIPTSPGSNAATTGVSLTAISSGAATSYYDKLTSNVATLLGAITSSAQSQSADCPGTATMSITWSQTPTAYNLTTSASCATCQIRPVINAATGGAGVRYQFATYTASASDLQASGLLMNATSTAQVWPYMAPGTILTIVSNSSTSVVGSLGLHKRVNFGASCP